MSNRIAYVINSLEGGGAAAMVPAITSFFRLRGYAVKVFVLTPRNMKAEPALKAAHQDYAVRVGGEQDHWSAYRWLLQSLKAWQPTQIWTSLTRSTLIGQQVGRVLKVPVISWQHNAFLKPGNIRLLRAMRNMSVLWVADSSVVADITQQRLRLPESRLICWPVFQAQPAAQQARPWQPGGSVRIGSLGRLHRAKGYDVLCAALARVDHQTLPDFTVTVAGEGALGQELEHQALSLGKNRLNFSGFCADPAKFLADCHLYIQPSRREGFCIAAHEAMQAGLPVIGSETGEMARSILPGKTGWLIPPENTEALAQALTQALMRPDLLVQKGAAAREHVLQKFGPEQFAQYGDAVLERIAKLVRK